MVTDDSLEDFSTFIFDNRYIVLTFFHCVFANCRPVLHRFARAYFMDVKCRFRLLKDEFVELISFHFLGHCKICNA